jgi:hypothetical protein
MQDIDVLLRPEARIFYNEVATTIEQRSIDDIISIICARPHVDEAIRFSTMRGDTLYNDGSFWILYRALNNWTIEIIGIGTVSDEAPP